jgi:transcriptional regulator with XRE-family HTH domain
LNEIRIGEIIKQLRKFLGISQRELAEGVCSQAQISKIENGNEIPSALILFLLSKKLKVDMSFFFELSENPRLDYVKDVTDMISLAKRKREYTTISELIKKERNNPLFTSNNEYKQYIMWHEGICIYYLERNNNKALEILNESLKLTFTGKSLLQEREIEILNSIAIIHKDNCDFEKAINLYKEALNSLKYLPQVKDPLIKVKILYSLSKTFTDVGDFKQSLLYCDQGIEECKRAESLFLLGELHYQKGSNLYRMGLFEEGMEMIDKSKSIFEIQGNFNFVELVEEQKESLINSNLQQLS